MKKITLLLVVAVFTIGIQSCSTKEEVYNEKSENIIPDDFLNADDLIDNQSLLKASPESSNTSSCFTKIYVVFPKYSTIEDHIDYTIFARKFKFSSIMYSTFPYCNDVYEWYVPCNEIPTDNCIFACSPIDNLKSEGSKTHAAETSNLSDNEDEDPACGRICNGAKGWGLASDLSCSEIKKSVGLLLNEN
ncbi:hypothetical protein M0D21_13980 [Aquimarina sp. D1M17]|uniref:hypothetical protein n=1 Tax=Aquimarina acroporae TaxID=2937283 RepID=UPI0020BDDE72|nr:hypothetical protein [Aquimarina acroporae]MCK8522689.1 hypothetical protein [Aquimarina acroporae]